MFSWSNNSWLNETRYIFNQKKEYLLWCLHNKFLCSVTFKFQLLFLRIIFFIYDLFSLVSRDPALITNLVIFQKLCLPDKLQTIQKGSPCHFPSQIKTNLRDILLKSDICVSIYLLAKF